MTKGEGGAACAHYELQARQHESPPRYFCVASRQLLRQSSHRAVVKTESHVLITGDKLGKDRDLGSLLPQVADHRHPVLKL